MWDDVAQLSWTMVYHRYHPPKGYQLKHWLRFHLIPSCDHSLNYGDVCPSAVDHRHAPREFALVVDTQ